MDGAKSEDGAVARWTGGIELFNPSERQKWLQILNMIFKCVLNINNGVCLSTTDAIVSLQALSRYICLGSS